jgi:tetraacyldisaccharide 4'-kinase
VLVSDGEIILADAKKTGDEPLELAEKLLGKAIVLADGDRVSAGLWAKEKFSVTAFVLDDAFQHRRVERDLDIVLINGTNPFGNGKSLQLGLLREPPENLARAGAIVITRANLADNIDDLKAHIAEFAPDVPVFTSWNRTSRVIELGGPKIEARGAGVGKIGDVLPKKALAFCGLGNPESFFEQLRREGYNLAGTEVFRDHHNYTQEDIDLLERTAANAGAEILLSTQKDAVKLRGLYFERPCFAVESELVFDDEEGFREMIYGFLSGGPFLSPQ